MNKAYVVIIRGGRAGDSMDNTIINLTNLNLNDEDTIENILNGEYCDKYINLTPNLDDDVSSIVKVLKGENNMWIGWDVFGEGVIGITTNKSLRNQLIQRVRSFYCGVEDDTIEWGE